MSARRALVVAVGVGVLLGGALALRTANEVLVSGPEGVHFAAPGDPYYHMRRIAYSVARFPAVLEHDPYVNFPNGARIVWPPAFDWGIAAVARAWVGPDDPAGVERLAARVPALLGVLTVAVVALVAGRRFSPGAGWLAGGILAVLPAHLLHSQSGQLDHHVAVALLAAILTGVALAAVARADGPSRASAVALGAGFAVALLVWPGALLHVAVLDALLVPWALLAGRAEQARARAAWLAGAHALALLAVAPAGLGADWPAFGPWSPWVLSNFQPAFFAAASLVLAATAGLAAHPTLGATAARRAGVALGVGGVALAVAFAAIPGLLGVLDVSAGWFAKAEDFQGQVSELRPFDPLLAASRFTLLVFAFPWVWAVLVVRGLRRGARAEAWVLLGGAAAFFALATLQRRFGNSFSVFYALFWGLAAAELGPAARDRWRAAARGRRVLAALGGLVAAALVLDSLAGFHAERLRLIVRARENPAVAARGPLPVRHRLFDAGARWLGEASPETAGWLDPEATPEYGVLCSWDAGHMVRYRARRPLVQDNFGVYGGREGYEAARRYFAEYDEARAVEALRALGVRYVLADREGAGRREPYARGSMTDRLAGAFGSAQRGAAGLAAVPALRHHRLVWHQRSGGAAGLAAEAPGYALGIWEIVPGARVRGRASAGERVEARLRLVTRQGRRHTHRSETRADAAGRYAFVLPYPTDRPFSDAVRAAGPWQIEGDRRSARLEVREAAVRSGSELDGPDLRAPAHDAGLGIGG